MFLWPPWVPMLRMWCQQRILLISVMPSSCLVDSSQSQSLHFSHHPPHLPRHQLELHQTVRKIGENKLYHGRNQEWESHGASKYHFLPLPPINEMFYEWVDWPVVVPQFCTVIQFYFGLIRFAVIRTLLFCTFISYFPIHLPLVTRYNNTQYANRIVFPQDIHITWPSQFSFVAKCFVLFHNFYDIQQLESRCCSWCYCLYLITSMIYCMCFRQLGTIGRMGTTC